MLPLLFGSLSKWLTSNKPVSRAERRVEILKSRKQQKKLELEHLEERVTPTVRLYTNDTLSSLVNTYTGSSAIDDALGAAASGNTLTVDNDEAYADFRITGAGSGTNSNLIIRPHPTLTNVGAPIFVDASSSFGNNSIAFITTGSSNITIRGLTFQNTNLLTNYVGIRVNTSTSGIHLEENTVKDLYNGVQVFSNVNGISILRSDIKNNSAEGVVFNGGSTNNITFTSNFIRGNAFGATAPELQAAGVRFLNTFGTGTASTNTFRNNFFENNGNFGAVRNATTGGNLVLLDFSGSWWGSSAEPVISNSGTPGAANNNRISVVSLPNAAVDYTPWLNSGTDTNSFIPGFQGDFSYLNVSANSPQFGATTRIQEGNNLLADGALTGAGRIVDVKAGTYADTVQIDRSGIFRGPNAAISPNTGVRVAEAILNNAGGTAFTVATGTVNETIQVAGFSLTGSGGTFQQQASGVGGNTLSFNKNLTTARGQLYLDDQKAGGGTTTLTIDDNRFLNSTSNAMQLIGNATNLLNATVSNNTISVTTNAGINTDGLSNSLISGNTISNTSQQAIQIAGPASNVTISNNIITNANTSGDSNRGGITLTNTTGITGIVQISGNTLSRTVAGPVNGITIRTGSDITGKNIQVSNNTFTGFVGSFGIRHNGVGELDLTPFTNTFDGVAVSAGSSNANLFWAEDRTFHGPDNGTSGVVRQKAGRLFVTTPGTGTSDEKIQFAIDSATPGNTIEVQAGTYAENVTINKSLNVVGPNAGINAGTTPGVRGAEAVLVPGIDDAASGVVVTVTASNVTIDGFTIDGDNPSLNAGVLVNGIDSNANSGIDNNDAAISNLTVRNNYLRNFTGNGVVLGESTGTQVLSGLSILRNGIDNIPLNGPTFFGRGVLFFNNAYGNIEENAITRARTGVQTNNSNLANSGPAATISNNTIAAYVRGIFHNLHYQLSSPWTISGNSLTAEVGSPAGNGGLIIASIQQTVSVNISNNNVSGFDSGIVVWNNPTTAGITINGGTISNSISYGLNLRNVDPGFGDAAGTTNLTLSGVNFVNNPTALRVFDDPANATGSVVNLGLSNVSISNSSTGLLVSGADTGLIGNTLANTVFTGVTGNFVTLANGALGSPFVEVNGTGASFNGVVGSGASVAQGYAIEDKITHATDAAGLGYVRITSGRVYVTQNSNSIQRGVNVANPGEAVHVDAGTFIEDVTANKAGLQLLGSGPGSTTISGAIGGPDGATIRIAANNVLVDGFTITREGNNTTDWNNPALNSAGLAIQGLSFTGAEIRNNSFFGNRTGIDINNSGGHSIHNNLIDNNRTGLIFRNQTDNITAYENFITNNWTVGVLFLDGSGGSNVPPQQAVGTSFFNNNISGNWYGQIVDRQVGGSLPAPGTNIKNFSGNWFGTNSPAVSTANSTEPGYAAQIPVIFGGSAVPPGGQPDILGPASANFDYSPYLDVGTDTSPGTYGFQGDFSTLWVTSADSQTGAPSYSRVQEGYDLTTAGGLVRILGGSYDGNVTTGVKAATLSPGASPAIVTINGSFTLSPTTTLAMELNGLNPGTGYDQFVVNGDVTLNNAILNATRTYGYIAGNNVVLIVNNSANPTSGTFAGQGEGSTLNVTGLPFSVTYIYAPTGNDVALQLLPQTNVWVDDNWTIAVDSDSSSTLTPGDIVNSAGGTVLGKVFGYNAFSTIQNGVNGVFATGNVWVLSGTYDEAVAVNKTVTIDGELDAAPAPILTYSGAPQQQALLTVTATNVTLRDLELRVNRPYATAGIYASDTLADFSNLQLLNNTITSYGTGSGVGQNFVTPDGNTNAAGIVLLSFTTANLPVTVQGNTINAGPDPDGGGPLTASVFTRGIWLRRVVGSIGGVLPGEGNTIFANTQDLLVRFNDPSTTLVQNNTFQGAGMDISETNPGVGVINILDNQFVPVSPLFSQSLSIKYNYDAGRVINVDGNTFSGHGNIGIISGASKNVNITDNVFTPAAGSANFTHVLMSSSYPTGGAPVAITGNSITLTGNSFNNAAGASGRGIDFQNGNNTGSTFGAITVGGAGALANQFAAGLTQFIRLSPFPLAPLFNPASNPTPAPFNVNFDASQNQFDVGAGLQLPASMTLAQRFSLEDKILHKVDVGSVGFVTTVAGQVFVTPNSFLAPFTNLASIQRGINAATSGDTVNVQAATYLELDTYANPLGASYPSSALLVDKSVTILGDGVVTVTTPTSPATLSPGLAVFNIAAPNVTLNNLNIQVQQSYAGAGVAAFSNFGGLAVTGVTIRSFGFGGAIAQGSWLPGTSTYGIVVANIDGGSPTVAITNTSVLPDNIFAPTSIFGRAVYLQGTVSTVSGVLGTHAFVGLGQDFQITTAAAGVSSVSGMTFPAAGATIFGTLPGATVNLTGNVFDQPSAGLPAFPDKSLTIAENQDGNVNVTGNQFTNVRTNKIALISGRSKNVSVTGNTFSAAVGATNFTYIVMSTAYPTSSHPPTSIIDNSIIIQGNIFNGGSSVTGRAIDFQNGNSVGAGWGAITIGGAAPADRNSFGANLGEFVRLSPATIITPSFGNPAPGAFTPNLNVSGNLFDLGSGLQLPASFSMAQNFGMENKVYHKIDNGTVGLVTWNANNVYVTTAAVPTATDNDYTRINNAIFAVSNGFSINLLGTFNWAETNASASWALGSDGIASNYDDYAILAPANLNSVTLTAPLGLTTATIQGPGDLASVNLEAFIYFVTGNGPGAGYANSTNSGWTISNLEIFDFDLSLGFFLDGGSQNLAAFSNTTIQNNTIRVPVDLNATVAPLDVNQNIGIHLSVGTNQTITGNTILFPGSGVSDSANSNFSSRVGLQSNTTGGLLYDNLQITNNQLIVSGAQSADPENILGIWENGHNHLANITISGNSFTNTNVGNNPVLNLQRAFRVTSHSSGSSTVTYSGNTVDGANIGFQWIAGSNFAGNQPVVLTDNTILNTNTGILIQSNGSANINNSIDSNTLNNTGAMAGVGTGIRIVAGSSATISGNNATISGFATGIDVFGSATINNNTIHTNTTGIRFNAGATGSVTNNEFRDTVGFLGNGTDLRLEVGAGALSAISGNTFGGGSGSPASFTNANGYFIDNRSNVAYDLTAAGNSWQRSNGSAWTVLNTASLTDNFRIEDRIYGALDNAASGRITIVAGTRYVSTPGSGLNDETIQRAVDASDAGNTIRVEAGTYAENVIVDESVTIWGAGQGLTNVVPAFIGANMGGGSLAPGHSTLFLIRSNNVTIRNLTADGNNPLLVSGVVVNGSDVDARNGIITDHVTIATPITGLTVQNVTVQNVWLRGIQSSTDFGSFAFTNNIVSNVAGNPGGSIGIFNFGGGGTITGNQVSQTVDGIASNWSVGTTYSGNTVTNSSSGIHSDNAGGYGGPSVPDVISGNTVQTGTVGSYGIFVFVPYNAVQVSSNIVNDVDVGLAAFASSGGGSATFTGNQVNTNNRAGSLGAWVSTTTFFFGSGNVNATFTGNTLKNSATLLLVEQENAMNVFGPSLSTRPSIRVNHTEHAPATPPVKQKETPKGGGKDKSKGGPVVIQPLSSLPPVVASVVLNSNAFDNTTTSLTGTFGVDVNGGNLTINAGNQILATQTGLRMSSAVTASSLVGNTLNNLVFTGVTGNYVTLTAGALDNLEINGTAATYNGVLGSSASVAQGFAIEDKMQHAVDAATLGFVRVKTGNVYVTPNSFAASESTTTPQIQRGVDAGINNDTVWVQSGLYDNDVIINKTGMSVIGEGYATTTIRGVIGNGQPDTVLILSPNVTLAGFTVTRAGNSLAQWNNPGLNNQGVSIVSTGAVVRDNLVTGNRNGIYIDGGAGNVLIRNNIVNDNRTGIHTFQVNGLTITENDVSNNWTMGILFRNEQVTNSTTGPIDVFNNSITGNYYAGIERRWNNTAVQINASGNWFSSNTPVYVSNNAGNSGEPGYSSVPLSVPVAFGGTAAPIFGAPDILESTGFGTQVDFTPFLWTGVDTNSGAYADTNGFQGDFSNLGVTTVGAQVQPVSRIQEGYNLLPITGGTLHVLAGTYAGNVTTGAKPTVIDIGAPNTSAQITINGSLTLTPSTTVNFNLSGPNTSSPVGGTDYDQIITTGATDLGGATFNITRTMGYFPNLGSNFALVRSTVAKTGSFNYGGTVAENAIIAVDGVTFQVNYNLGSGPFDLNLGVTVPAGIVYVWDGWTGETIGDYYQPSPLVNTLAAPPGGYATFSGTPVAFGYNAYATIQDAINAVGSGMTIRVYIGTYAEDVTVPGGKNNLQLVAWGATGSRFINGVAGGPTATFTLNGNGTSILGNSGTDNFVVNQTVAGNLAGIRTGAGSTGSTVSYVNVSGSVNTTAFSGVDVSSGSYVSYSNGSITNYRTGIRVNTGAGSAANPVDVQNATINGSGWASLTVMPAGVDVATGGFARLTNGNVISGNRWGVRVLGGTAMLQGNNLSNNTHTGASAAGLFVTNGGTVDAGQVIDGSEFDYTGLGISSGNNLFTAGYAMGGAQAIVNLNADFIGTPSGPGNVTTGTHVSARNNNFGTSIYGNIEQVVNHSIDNNFVGMVDYRNAVGAVAPLQEGATDYYAVAPGEDLPNQRSMIRGMQFVIDSPVVIQTGAFNLTRRADANPADYLYFYTSTLPQNASVPVTISSSINGATGRTTVNVTFTSPNTGAWNPGDVTEYGSLVDGNYFKTIDGSLVNLLFANSGVNYAGGAVTDEAFHRFYGDLNGDTLVDGVELGSSADAILNSNSAYNKYFARTGGTSFNDNGIFDDVFARFLQAILPNAL